MTHVFVKPVAGRMVRYETTHQVLHKRGAFWPNNAYTNRLLRAGDIVLATAPGMLPATPAPAESSNTAAAPVAKKRVVKH